MIYILLCILLSISSLYLFKKVGFKYYLSLTFCLLTLLSLLANISLSQNYSQNLRPDLQDGGYTIGSSIARLILPDDRWSLEMFHTYFNVSLMLTFILIIFIVVCLLVERKIRQ
ncbi:hypothetical protein SAMN04488601_102248 [Paenibacillus sp. 453mf]|nr:hypothetical protein SAMN04488601_102248 [Paenibacillus sp. 453mf]